MDARGKAGRFMTFARKVWKLLVAFKDALALVFLLLFFAALYAVLSARPNPGQVREGALLLDLDGVIVEERSEVNPLQLLLATETPTDEFQARDVERALRRAAKDDRVKVVVLDLSRFLGGGFAHLHDIGAAMDAARAAGHRMLLRGRGRRSEEHTSELQSLMRRSYAVFCL